MKWMKVCILSFTKKGDHDITKNYIGINITATAAKLRKILEKSETLSEKSILNLTNSD